MPIKVVDRHERAATDLAPASGSVVVETMIVVPLVAFG